MNLKDKRETIKQLVCPPGIPDIELDNFIEICEDKGLNPLTRQMHIQANYDKKAGKNKYSCFTTIDGVRVIAERTGEYEGQDGPYWYAEKTQKWQDVYNRADGRIIAAKVGVYRKGFDRPVYAIAHWSEYGKEFGTWAKMPSHMLSKCAEVGALRKCFPQDLSGIYTDDELPEEMTGKDNKPKASKAQEVQKPVENFKEKTEAIEEFKMIWRQFIKMTEEKEGEVDQAALFKRLTEYDSMKVYLSDKTVDEIRAAIGSMAFWLDSYEKNKKQP